MNYLENNTLSLTIRQNKGVYLAAYPTLMVSETKFIISALLHFQITEQSVQYRPVPST